MTEEEWKVFVELLTEDEEWILVQSKDLRNR